jgi:hypothetical protein
MDKDPEIGLPDGVFSTQHNLVSPVDSIRDRLLVTDGSDDDDGLSRRDRSRSACRSACRIPKCMKSCDAPKITSVVSCLTLLVILTMVGIGIGFYVAEYPAIQKVVSFVSQLEDINITQIKDDIKTISGSMGEIRELTEALSQIKNKTKFIERIVFVVDYACNIIHCDTASTPEGFDLKRQFGENGTILLLGNTDKMTQNFLEIVQKFSQEQSDAWSQALVDLREGG